MYGGVLCMAWGEEYKMQELRCGVMFYGVWCRVSGVGSWVWGKGFIV